MLDRATRCLNHAGRQAHQSLPKGVIQSQRTLHSAFWRHGAGDLEHLPTWCFATIKALFEPDENPHGGGTLAAPALLHTPAPFLLDFLYPRKAREYLCFLSLQNERKVNRRFLSLQTTHHRESLRSSISKQHHYTQVAAAPHEDLEAPIFQHNNDDPISQEQRAAESELLSYLDATETGANKSFFIRAWRAYLSIHPLRRSTPIVSRLIKFLSQSPRALDAKRIIKLFDTLPIIDRKPSTCCHVIEAHLKLSEIRKAFFFGKKCMKTLSSDQTYPIFFELMGYAVHRSFWPWAFDIWDLHTAERNEDELVSQQDLNLFEALSQTPDYSYKIKTLLLSIKDDLKIIESERRKALVRLLVRSAISSSVTDVPKEDQIAGYLTLSHDIKLNSSQLYDLATTKILENANGSKAENFQTAFSIYKLCASHGMKPRMETLKLLVKVASETGNEEAVSTLLVDWRNNHGPPQVRYMLNFMKFFANRGKIDTVNKIFKDYAESGGKMHVVLFYPRLHAYALAAEPSKVEQVMFTEMQEYNLRPNIYCWNMLMNAFKQTDDLDGAVLCMSRLLETDLKPDDYTLGTLMSIAADRGDVELVKQLRESRKSYGIEETQIMNDCFVLALLRNDLFDAAKAFALSVTARNAKTATRMWNQLLTHMIHGNLIADPLKEIQVLHRTMRELHVPFDSMSFSALIRVYMIHGQFTAVGSIIGDQMPKAGISLSAFHYALLIDGYANHGEFEAALKVQKDMLQANVEPDFNVRLALQKLHILASRSVSKTQSIVTTREDLSSATSSSSSSSVVATELLDEVLTASDSPSDVSPRLFEKGTGATSTETLGYIGSLLSMWSRRDAIEVAEALVKRYETLSANRPEHLSRTPLRLIASLMNLRDHQHDHEQVDRYWQLAKRAAVVEASHQQQVLPRRKRTLLARHLDTYMRSLSGQNKQNMIPKVAQELVSLGFDLDSHNWNMYIQLIAAKGNFLESFLICEQHLIHLFAGWHLEARGIKNESSLHSSGFETQATRGVEYRTMVRLAHVIRTLRSNAPFDVQSQYTLSEIKRRAPKTYEAVIQMPIRKLHPTVTHVLGKSTHEKGVLRTL